MDHPWPGPEEIDPVDPGHSLGGGYKSLGLGQLSTAKHPAVPRPGGALVISAQKAGLRANAVPNGVSIRL